MRLLHAAAPWAAGRPVFDLIEYRPGPEPDVGPRTPVASVTKQSRGWYAATRAARTRSAVSGRLRVNDPETDRCRAEA